MYKRARRVNKYGFNQISGNAESICRYIVKNCWNGYYFFTSTGHFRQFWIRDFAICVEALVGLGYKEEVSKTLNFVLNIFNTNNVITTCLTPEGQPLDVFNDSPDSLPLLLTSIRLSKSYDLLVRYENFIRKQTEIYYNSVFDKLTGLVKKNKTFSEMGDSTIVSSSCYNNCMLALLSDELTKMNLFNPFAGLNFKENIKKHFWTGDYFLDDLSGRDYVAGDAQVFPFWCNIIKDENMLDKALLSIKKAGLEQPMPLKHANKQAKNKVVFPLNLILKDYQGDSIWMNIGLCYLDVLKKFNKKELLHNYLALYKKSIEENKTFLELFNSDGSLYKKFHYVADEGMLWAAKYLFLVENPKSNSGT
ncbi:MAG: hypothetical protein HYV47_00050 [Candidatus Nealsonbacteria bacterium]|nr:hypothetical protein [Candidatus Nealsonbacteria bacterium]